MPAKVIFKSGKATPQILSCKCIVKRKKAATAGTPSAIAKNILQSMVATVKRSESEAIQSFCAALIADQYSTIKKDISYLCSSMLVIEARMDALEGDVQSVQRDMADRYLHKSAEFSPKKTKTESQFNEKSNVDMISRPLTMCNDSSDAEKVLADFMQDMHTHSKGLAESKDLLRHM